MQQDFNFAQFDSPDLGSVSSFFDEDSQVEFFHRNMPIEITLSGQSILDEKPVGDFSQLPPDIFIFSRRCVDALREILERHGKLFKASSGFGDYFAYFVSLEINALDEQKSIIRKNASGRINLVKKIAFKHELIEGIDIFQLPELPMRAYVSESFVDIVRKEKLLGFDFVECE